MLNFRSRSTTFTGLARPNTVSWKAAKLLAGSTNRHARSRRACYSSAKTASGSACGADAETALPDGKPGGVAPCDTRGTPSHGSAMPIEARAAVSRGRILLVSANVAWS